MLLIAIIIYLLVTLSIGVIAGRFVNNAKDFALAGRRMPVFITASALFATWFGAETVLGASSAFVNNGVLGIIEDPFGAALCLVLLGMFFVKALYKLDLLTISDFFRQKFGPRVEIIAALFVVMSYFGWTAAQLIAFSIVLNTISGIPFIWGILVAAAVVLIYTYFGGMIAVSVTDFLQTLVIVFGLGFILVTLFLKIENPMAIIEAQPIGFFDFTPKHHLHDYFTYICAWFTIGLGSLPSQDLFQRVMSANSEATARRACYLGAFLYLTVGLVSPIIALLAINIYPDLSAADGEKLLVYTVMRHGDLFVQIAFFGALLSAIMSTASGCILASATTLSENIIKPLLPKLDEKSFLLLMRLSVVLMTLIGVLLASTNKSIYELVGESSMLSLVSLFVAYVAGLWWKKATSLGAELSILAGIGFWSYTENFPIHIMGTEVPSMLIAITASAIAMVVPSFIINNSKFANNSVDANVQNPSQLTR